MWKPGLQVTLSPDLHSGCYSKVEKVTVPLETMWNLLRVLLECLGLRSRRDSRTVSEILFIIGLLIAASYRLVVIVFFFIAYGYAYIALSMSVSYCVECLNALFMLKWIRKNSRFIGRNVTWSGPFANSVELSLYGLICFLRAQRVELMSGKALHAWFRTQSVFFLVAEGWSVCFALLPWLSCLSLQFKCLKCIESKLRVLKDSFDTNNPEKLKTLIAEVVRLMDDCNASLKDFFVVGYFNQALLSLMESSSYPFIDSTPEFHQKQGLARALTEVVVLTACVAGNSIERALAGLRQTVRWAQVKNVGRQQEAEIFLSQAENMGVDTGLGRALSFKMAIGYISFTGSSGWVIIQTAEHLREVYKSSSGRS